MVSRAALLFFCVCALTLADQALGDPALVTVSILAGPLPDALQSLERQTGIDLLFDHDAVNGLQCPAVSGKLSAETALHELVSQTDLTVRRAESGAWIVERPAAPALAQPDAAVPEVLVIGQRTQDADLRRVENDVQPYTIVTQDDLVAADRDNVGQYFESRVTSNTQIPNVGFGPGSLSSIDLRGLGSQNTLVLIDGRRMPRIADSGTGLDQTDLNAIPPHAIQRIEVLTGAAGGIYGFGALGGVVNVILDHDYQGLDLHVTEGITSRGDAWRQMLEASFGHTSLDGRTDFTVFASHSQSDALLVGQRDYAAQERAFNNQFFPRDYTFGPQGNSVAVVNLFGSNLVLKPAFGGAALNSSYTFLPAGFSGSPSALAVALMQNAGKLDPSISEGDAGTDLLPNIRTDSLLVNLRHRFEGGFEVYADAILLWNRGDAHERTSNGSAIITPDSPANPFTDDIEANFPITGVDLHASNSDQSIRSTLGLTSDLAFGWRGSAEASFGSLQDTSTGTDNLPEQVLTLTGDPSDLTTNPFGNWNALQQAITSNPGHIIDSFSSRNRFQDDALRLAGPLFIIGEHPATLTVLGERRTEYIPGSTAYSFSENDGTTIDSSVSYASHSSDANSVYAELRAPLFGTKAPLAVLRGLELQLAVRRDDERDTFDLEGQEQAPTGLAHVRFVGTAFTAGVKSTPWNWLMLRASYATGQQPPPVDALTGEFVLTTTASLGTDPKRGGQPLGADGPYEAEVGGNVHLSEIGASTLFFGFVLTPLGSDGPRLSIDYSSIRKTNDVFIPTVAEILANEGYWPERVTRGPLTPADQALGYTAGPVIAINDLAANGAGLLVKAFDAQVSSPIPFLVGHLRVYANATYQMSNIQTQLFQPDVESDGDLNGPLKWRANGGFDWSKDGITISANLQYFGHYLVLEAGEAVVDPSLIRAQGSNHVPSQVYLDFHATWRLPIPIGSPLHDVTLDFGLVNALDAAPALAVTLANFGEDRSGPGYSGYGDPRQRRFELALSHRF